MQCFAKSPISADWIAANFYRSAVNQSLSRAAHCHSRIWGYIALLVIVFGLSIPCADAETSVLPFDQWSNADIGTTPAAGSGTYNSTTGTYTIKGSGADIGGTTDSFHYTYRPLNGDGVITVRVQSLTNTNSWAKAGIMIRETLQPGSAYAMMMVTPVNGTGIQYRSVTGGSTTNVLTPGVSAPRWLRLERRGNVLAGYQSPDGVNWTLNRRIAIPLATNVFVGLAAGSRTSSLTTLVADQIVFEPKSDAMTLPWPWAESTVGTPIDQGVALHDNDGSYILANLGAEMWVTADKLKFVSQPLSGDGTLIVRATSVVSNDAWSRFGLMMRESLSANAKNVLFSLTTSSGLAFQSRQTVNGSTAFRAAAVAKTAPVWLKLERSGNTFTASYSSDGVVWAVHGTETIFMSGVIQVGLAYSNRSSTTWALGTGDQLKLVTPSDADGNGISDEWENFYFGQTGIEGNADADTDGLSNAQEWELGTSPTAANPVSQSVSLSVAGGNNQSGYAGSTLPTPLSVQVKDPATGAPISGLLVTFKVLSGAGALGGPDSQRQTTVSLPTDQYGRVQASFHLPSVGGSITVQASAGNLITGAVNFSLKSLLGAKDTPFRLETTDVGTVTLPSVNQYSNGVYTLSAASADIGSSADSFDYASQVLNGNGLIVARVAGFTATNTNAKAGLMIRESVSSNSRYVAIVVTPGSGLSMRWRDTTGGGSSGSIAIARTVPTWLALRRSGGSIAGYYSDDGLTWTLAGTRAFVAPAQVMVGLAAATLSTGYSQATFDSLRLAGISPEPWQGADIGTFNIGNIDEFTAGSMLIRSCGADIWGYGDSFRYIYQPLPGDGSVIVRVASQANTATGAKSGIMIRESTSNTARNILLTTTPSKGVILQARSAVGGGTGALGTLTNLTAPVWLRLDRLGSVVEGYASTDGQTWVKVGSTTWSTGPTLIGLATSSLNTTSCAATTYDNVSAGIYAGQQGWSAAYFAGNDLSGTASVYRRDAAVDFTWAQGQVLVSGLPVGASAVRWSGLVQPAATGSRIFKVTSNGGVRLWVNDNLVIDSWALKSSVTELTALVTLPSDQAAKVVVEYFKGTEAGRIQLGWSEAGLPNSAVPLSAVQPTDTDNDGIPDTWEAAQGLNPLDPIDAGLAPDGDLLSNLSKYLLGLSPGSTAARTIGGIISEEWRTVPGVRVVDLTSSARFSGTPNSYRLLRSLSVIPNHADNYGTRIRGYIIAPQTGSYKFWVAADDQAELWLSSDDSPYNRKKIARVDVSTVPEAYDAKPSQGSGIIQLEAGRYYYIEVLQKENTGLDHISVAWARPGSPRELIGSSYLATFVPIPGNLAGDGIPDAWKTANNFSTAPGGASIAYADSDGDGLNNLAEYQAHTDPNLTDSDGDGVLDGVEIQFKFDPLDIGSHPIGIAPWVYTRVGLADASGAGFDSGSPGYVVRGNGGGIRGAAGLTPSYDDDFGFLSQEVTGNFDLSAQVSNIGEVSGASALVVRDGFGATATSAAISLDDTGEIRFQVRSSATSGTVILKKAATTLTWLRLQRSGQIVNAYSSSDGQRWMLLYSAIVNLPALCDVGMGGWSTTAGLATFREFSHVVFTIPTSGEVTAPAQGTNLDPLLPNNVGQVIAIYNGAAATTTLGSWRRSDNALISKTVKAGLNFEIQLSADGAYVLEIEAKSGGDSTINTDFPVRISIDGQFIDRVNFFLVPGQIALARVGTPWLKAGVHNVELFYDNTQSYRYLQVNALRVVDLGGGDLDGNGRADWEDTRLSASNSFRPGPLESFTSPVCVEGVSRFVSMLGLTADGQPITPQIGPGFGWYADIPLSAIQPVVVSGAFENGALTESFGFTWKPFNLLSDVSALPSGKLRIRKGDSLRLTANPEGSSEGVAVVTIARAGAADVVLALSTPQVSAAEYQFAEPGTYTVTGVYTADSTPITGTFTVEVVDAHFNGNPVVGLGTQIAWDNPQLPTGLFYEVDQGLTFALTGNLAGGGQRVNVGTQNAGDSYVLARISTGGPIVARAKVQGLTVASDEATANDVLSIYADGSRLLGTPIILNQITPDIRVVVEIFVKGVTFEDGTILKTLTAADFDQYGRVYVKFLYPKGLNTSFCHRIHVYNGSTDLGTF